MRAKELKNFKKKLLEKREELIVAVQKTETYGREADAEGEAMDIADRATSSYTKEFMFSKSNTDRQLLQKVTSALERIEGKSFGECVNCGGAGGKETVGSGTLGPSVSQVPGTGRRGETAREPNLIDS